MRAVLACLLLLALGGVSSAQPFPTCPTVPDVGPELPYDPNLHPNDIPCKRIRIFNNSPSTLWVIIEAGAKTLGPDEWLQGWFKVSAAQGNTRTYKSAQVARIYINGTTGIAPNSSAEVWLPFYTRLSNSFDGTTLNQFIDWWNGGRIYFYDSQQNITDDFNY